MLFRKISERIERFYENNTNKALLITGARQVGKTFIIREYGKQYKNFVEINFLDNQLAVSAFNNASNSKDLLLRISAITNQRLVPNETLIFLDEVQECKEIITAIKFLVEEGSYQYILSGSLLGVELKDIRSIPVGYMGLEEMYPLDFEEFAIANGVSRNILEVLKDSFENKKEVDIIVHEKMMELFRLYLVIGGMPSVVMKYLATNNLQDVILEQESIISQYKKDIAKYDPHNKLYLEEIFNLIPSELNNKNKRFIMKRIKDEFKFNRYENSFLWLKNAGVAIPTYCSSEPVFPLLLNKCKNLFKLFASDVGLLASMYMNGIQLKILNKENSINFGSIYENVAAQELRAHGFDLYYFNSKKQGELDFIIEYEESVLPIEIKSGKDYTKHNALSNVLNNKEYNIQEAFVFSDFNVNVNNGIVYYPIYMLMFVQKRKITNMVYTINIDVLK